MIATAPQPAYRDPIAFLRDPEVKFRMRFHAERRTVPDFLTWAEKEHGFERQHLIHACSLYLFQPRQDQPERFDEQQSFVNERIPGTAWLVGGNGSGTTECAMHKIARFVLDHQPPPRKDTPFWIISVDLATTMEAWAEKLHGHGHIPESEIDWDRIHWHKRNKNWPFSVPLKPWPGRPNANWRLEFKSCDQKARRLMARSIGGFCFMEQFPYEVLMEVKRGCREYNFPGSQICEFTPVDPNICPEIEEMIDNGPEPDNPVPGLRYLPASDRVYRCNTRCAMEAGHISKEWFQDFFGMVSEEMMDTRMIGAFATFEGQIYKTLDPHIHFVGDDEVFPGGMFPRGVHHRRGIDWGAGPDNPFACVWCYRNGMGQWFAYDEYLSSDQTYTTVDHLSEVVDKWPWPSHDNHYGTTYADPSSPDNIRIAQKLPQYTDGKYRNINMQAGANAVIEGIEHIQWLLKPSVLVNELTNGHVRKVSKPRLFIHRQRCPNLCRFLRSYRWKKSNPMGLNPQDARKEPLKKNDHLNDALRYVVFTEARHQGTVPDSIRREADWRSRGLQLQRRR